MKFLSSENGLRFICLREALYYCEFRIGEARGIPLEDIDFSNKILHDFRYSCASLLVSNQASLTVVSSFSGHNNTIETLKLFTPIE